jgi:hypothetical protein
MSRVRFNGVAGGRVIGHKRTLASTVMNQYGKPTDDEKEKGARVRGERVDFTQNKQFIYSKNTLA